MPTLVYLHGFLSSPLSTKARQTQVWLEQHAPSWRFFCPQLSSLPSIAVTQLEAFMACVGEPCCFVGSSLGGFWAAWLVETYGGKAILVNPAVAPHTRFQHYVGHSLKSYYSSTVYTLTRAELEVLACCDRPTLKDPSRYYVMLQTGDETLDYRMAEARYSQSQLCKEDGGNHSFVGYENYLPQIMEFASN